MAQVVVYKVLKRDFQGALKSVSPISPDMAIIYKAGQRIKGYPGTPGIFIFTDRFQAARFAGKHRISEIWSAIAHTAPQQIAHSSMYFVPTNRRAAARYARYTLNKILDLFRRPGRPSSKWGQSVLRPKGWIFPEGTHVTEAVTLISHVQTLH